MIEKKISTSVTMRVVAGVFFIGTEFDGSLHGLLINGLLATTIYGKHICKKYNIIKLSIWMKILSNKLGGLS